MKLLIVTQKVDINDDVLGFMHGWINEFAKHCEFVTVICLEKGDYDLPKNVKVLSLGKEGGKSQLKYIWRFYKYILHERKNYDKVFIHMNPEYVVLGGLFWNIWKKKIVLWYTHKSVDLKLRIAAKFTDVIFTASKKSFRLDSLKVKIMGHGIDVEKFSNVECRMSNDDKFKIITVGRISPVKDYETLIEAVNILKREGIKLQVDIIGGVGLPEQVKYLSDLKKTVEEKSLNEIINFKGAVSNKDIVNYLNNADLFVNMSQTGSLDKAILEAMACELPILTCNEALEEVLGYYREELMYPKKDYKILAEKIKLFADMEKEKRDKISKDLRNIVVNNHSLKDLIQKIIKKFNK